MEQFIEELNFRGAASMGMVLSPEEIQWFFADLKRQKELQQL